MDGSFIFCCWKPDTWPVFDTPDIRYCYTWFLLFGARSKWKYHYGNCPFGHSRILPPAQVGFTDHHPHYAGQCTGSHNLFYDCDKQLICTLGHHGSRNFRSIFRLPSWAFILPYHRLMNLGQLSLHILNLFFKHIIKGQLIVRKTQMAVILPQFVNLLITYGIRQVRIVVRHKD